MSELALETRALGKRYGKTWALRDCTLEVPAGSVAALVGPNGAGKTTLLHLAVGLTAPTAGTVRVLGSSARGRWADRVAVVAHHRRPRACLRLHDPAGRFARSARGADRRHRRRAPRAQRGPL